MRKRVSQIDKVFSALAEDASYPGQTASMIAKRKNVPRDTVMKRISDLRREGEVIFSNVSKRSGVARVYYRMPA